MSVLSGKNILICRPQEKSSDLITAFDKTGATIDFFPTFIINPLSGEVAEDANVQLRQLNTSQWLIFSSVNGLNAFQNFIGKNEFNQENLSSLKIGIVGKKTIHAWKTAFSQTQIHQTGDTLEQLLQNIAKQEKSGELSEQMLIIHPTSRESIKFIKPKIPTKIALIRIPVYETLQNPEWDPALLQKIKECYFDTIIFGSPTSFEYLRKILGNDSCLKCIPLSAFGTTTQSYINSCNFNGQIAPETPSPHLLVDALVSYFKQHESIKSKNNLTLNRQNKNMEV